MAYRRIEIPKAELERQREICFEIRRGIEGAGKTPLAFVDTYGCSRTRPTARSCAAISS